MKLNFSPSNLLRVFRIAMFEDHKAQVMSFEHSCWVVGPSKGSRLQVRSHEGQCSAKHLGIASFLNHWHRRKHITLELSKLAGLIFALTVPVCNLLWCDCRLAVLLVNEIPKPIPTNVVHLLDWNPVNIELGLFCLMHVWWWSATCLLHGFTQIFSCWKDHVGHLHTQVMELVE